MFEKPTQPEQPTKDERIDDPFNDIEQMQADLDFKREQREAAQRLLGSVEAQETSSPQGNTVEDRDLENDATTQGGFTRGQVATAAVLAGAAAFGVGAALINDAKGPDFSDKTHEYVIQPGDGLENAAMDVAGARTVDIRDVEHHISVDPANIDVLKDGLQSGEQLEVPDNVQK